MKCQTMDCAPHEPRPRPASLVATSFRSGGVKPRARPFSKCPGRSELHARQKTRIRGSGRALWPMSFRWLRPELLPKREIGSGEYSEVTVSLFSRADNLPAN